MPDRPPPGSSPVLCLRVRRHSPHPTLRLPTGYGVRRGTQARTFQASLTPGQVPVAVEWTQGQGASALQLLWKSPGGRKWEELPVSQPQAA